MALIRDEETGQLRPYDPDRDFDVPLHKFGALPPDPSKTAGTPLNPLHDLKGAS
jgi:hypothetical protein